MPAVPPIPVELWNRIPPAAQAAILALVQQYEQRLQALQKQVDDLQHRLNQNSTNSSRPPSSDPPHVKRPPPKPKKGRRGPKPKKGPRLPGPEPRTCASVLSRNSSMQRSSSARSSASPVGR